MELEALVINLDRSSDRLAAVEDCFGGRVSAVHRVAALEGGRIPKAAIPRLASSSIPATKWLGALGCTLSHMSAAEEMLKRKLPVSLILEDDARPTPTFRETLEALDLPADFDICFVNNRVGRALKQDKSRHISCVEMRDAIALLPSDIRAPGSDGYILSAAGAKKILDWFSADGFGGFYDWRLLAYSTDLTACQKLPADTTLRSMLEPLQRANRREERLIAFALTPSLVSHAAIASDLIKEGVIS